MAGWLSACGGDVEGGAEKHVGGGDVAEETCAKGAVLVVGGAATCEGDVHSQ